MFVTANDIQLAYSDAGQGQPVLFVHGYPLNRRMWQPQIDGLSGMCRTLAIDLRGHGESQIVPGPYRMEQLADDLNAFLDALGVRQPIVLTCLSMGGYVAFAFYRKYPQRVAGLALTATRALPDSPEVRANRTQAIATITEKGMAPIADSMAPRLLAPSHANSPLVNQVRGIMLETSPEGAMGDLAAMRDRPDSTPTLSQIHCPTIVIHGAEDQVIPRGEAQEMYEALRAAAPYAEMHILPDAGHMPNLEQPQAYNDILSAFIKRIDHRS
jgi:pimeloyl-ACP methyl ester carboxylesterase